MYYCHPSSNAAARERGHFDIREDSLFGDSANAIDTVPERTADVLVSELNRGTAYIDGHRVPGQRIIPRYGVAA